MGQTIARDIDYSVPRETGRYDLKLPFLNYPTPNGLVRQITRNYKVLHKGYAPALVNLTSYTNGLLYSDDFTQSSWSKAAVTATYNATTDTEGLTSCSLLAETATTAYHDVSQGSTVASSVGQTLRFSVFAKYAGRQYLTLNLVDPASVSVGYSNFDLTQGTVVMNFAGGTQIVPMANGWYWLSVYGVSTGTGTTQGILGLANTASGYATMYLGVAGVGAYLGRATLMSGAPGAIPPISTTTAARTITAPDNDAVVNPTQRTNWDVIAGEDCDPLAYQCQESDPSVPATNTGLLAFSKTYSRIPPEFITPTTYLFTSPNFGGASGASIIGAYTAVASVIGYYAVLANLNDNSAFFNGYYDVAYPCTANITTATADTLRTLTVVGNNYSPGDILLVQTSSGSSTGFWTASVITVSGSTVTVFGVGNSGNTGSLSQCFPISGQYCRKVIKDVPDTGQVVSLRAQLIEDYFLPGVSVGINTFADIPTESPFAIQTYFAALAAGSTWFNVNSDGLSVWMGSILVRKYTQAVTPGLIAHGEVTLTSSGNWTVPAGVTNIRRLTLVGGGGQGGGNAGGGGAGASPYVFENISVTAGTVFAYTIGPGGSTGTSGTAGQAGTATTFSGMSGAGGNGGGLGTGTSGGTGGASSFSGGSGSTGGGGGGAGGPINASATQGGAIGGNANTTNAGTGSNSGSGGGGGGACTGKLAALGGLGTFGNGGGGGGPTAAGGAGAANSGAGGGGGGAGAAGGPGGSGVIFIQY